MDYVGFRWFKVFELAGSFGMSYIYIYMRLYEAMEKMGVFNQQTWRCHEQTGVFCQQNGMQPPEIHGFILWCFNQLACLLPRNPWEVFGAPSGDPVDAEPPWHGEFKTSKNICHSTVGYSPFHDGHMWKSLSFVGPNWWLVQSPLRYPHDLSPSAAPNPSPAHGAGVSFSPTRQRGAAPWAIRVRPWWPW